MFIAEITSDISYISLHINYFGNDLFNNVYILVWQDYIVMILNVAANFAMVGAIRVLIVRMKWYPWQVVILKLFLLISSLLYVAIGIYYQATADSCTSAIQGLVNDSLDNIFNLNPVS